MPLAPLPSSKSGISGVTAGHAERRVILLEDLYARYGATSDSNLRMKWKYLRKKYLWKIVIGGSNFLKRSLDIAVCVVMMVLLAPLFAAVALLIRLTNAEALKDKLLASDDHQNGITFKMKKDPRITWIGRIIRKTSIDELPQLWCVLKGEMSLVGPRPPVPREVALYTLRDRRRLDVKPGLTCIWQVSGRGDIPFDKQVELDVQYIESQSFWLDILLLLKTAPAILIGKGAY